MRFITNDMAVVRREFMTMYLLVIPKPIHQDNLFLKLSNNISTLNNLLLEENNGLK